MLLTDLTVILNSINIFEENSHKNKINSDILTSMRPAVTPCQYLKNLYPILL